jgi:hypothetical protein
MYLRGVVHTLEKAWSRTRQASIYHPECSVMAEQLTRATISCSTTQWHYQSCFTTLAVIHKSTDVKLHYNINRERGYQVSSARRTSTTCLVCEKDATALTVHRPLVWATDNCLNSLVLFCRRYNFLLHLTVTPFLSFLYPAQQFTYFTFCSGP